MVPARSATIDDLLAGPEAERAAFRAEAKQAKATADAARAPGGQFSGPASNLGAETISPAAQSVGVRRPEGMSALGALPRDPPEPRKIWWTMPVPIPFPDESRR
jgi:hypothetical protein